MIVGKTRTDVDKLWNAFWTGGITNPVTVIEQINYLLFCRRLDDIETRAERIAERTKKPMPRRIFSETNQDLRWSSFKHLKSTDMFTLVQDRVFPFLKNLGSETEAVSTFSKTLSDAVFLIPKASLLASAVELISALDLDNSDTAGDLYEYLLSKLSTSGINGQFRTPRHIIRMMVELIAPKKGERICDPACGTGGFLFSSLQYILEKNTSNNLIQIDEDGYKHGFVGDLLSAPERKKFETDTFYGFDFDPTMLRVAAMNMWLHGIEEPHISYADTLSKHFVAENQYDLVLANPPFKGQLDYADCSPTLLNEIKTKKTELLFILLILRILDLGGRAAVIVPDGVLFGSSNAHSGVRKLLVEDNQLEGVVSMPGGFFKPYAGVSTAVLIFTKGGKTDKVWFYDMANDGFSLDDKRQPIEENDIPDVISCWENRFDQKNQATNQKRMESLRAKMEPLKQRRLSLLAELDELKFNGVVNELLSESAINVEKTKELQKLDEEIHVLQQEFNRLSRQFWVSKEEIVSNKYELTASRYRQLESDQNYLPEPAVIVNRLNLLTKSLHEQLAKVGALIK